MINLMNFAFNVFWQTALITIIGFILLKIFYKWSAPKRSLLSSSFLLALVLLPALLCVFMYTNIKTIKAESLNIPEFHYNIENIMPVNTPVIDKSPQAKKYEIPEEKQSEFLIPMPNISEMMTILVGIWVAGIIFMLGKLLYGLIFLNGFRFGLTLVHDEKINSAMKIALGVFNVKRLPGIYISSKVESPITIGIFKPIMILPENIYESLDENELKSIILHEFSHIYHYDHLMGLVKRIAIAINWWNPLVYKISAKHSIAREEVSDNYVLSQLKPKVYSECLVGLAEKTCLISNLPATVGMADKHISLEKRIKNILSNKRKKEIKTGKNIKGIIFTLSCLAIIFIGGIQYSFAHNPKEEKKEEMDSGAFFKLFFGGKKLSPEGVKKLEKKVAENISDSKAVIELLGYYYSKQYTNERKKTREKREKLILKFIKKHPESILFKWSQGCLDIVFDDYKAATRLWEAHIKKQPENLKILWNASRNLLLCDSKSAEKYLKKGQSLEPENTRWSMQLGLLYSFPTRQSDPKSALKSYEEHKRVYGQTKINKLYNILPYLGKTAYLAGKYGEAEKYAREMLWRGPKNANDHDIMIYNGTYLLGFLALKNGKTEEACKYLLESGKILNSNKRLFYRDMTLAYLLFLKNKHKCVAEYLKLRSKSLNKNDYKQWSADVKIGLMPNFRSLNYTENYIKALVRIASERCSKLLSIGKTLSIEEVIKLEKTVAANPEKQINEVMDIIIKLLGYYSQTSSKDKNIRAKKRNLIFLIIRNRPHKSILTFPEGQISSSKKDKELISLWKAQIKKRPEAKYILANAASQLSMHDKKLAEQCLKKCQELDPNNPEWSKRLGLFYDKHSEPKKALKAYKQYQKETKKDKIIKKEKNKEINTRDYFKIISRGRKLSPEKAEKLEIKVSENPNNVDAAIELLGYYSPRQFKDKKIKKKRGKLILKILENHPENKVFAMPYGYLDQFYDDYKVAAKLWAIHIKKQPKNLKILWNASLNLSSTDKKSVIKYLKKGQSLEPGNYRWAQQLGHLYFRSARYKKNPNLKKSLEEYKLAYKQFKIAYNESKMKESNVILGALTKCALKLEKFEYAEEYAHEMLRQTKKIGKKDWNYGNLIYEANSTLGLTALQKGNIVDSCKYLLKAGKTPGSPQLNSFGPDMTLANKLLEKGKRECVIEFLKSCSKFWKKDVCNNWIKEIESGATPGLDKNKWLMRRIKKKKQKLSRK